MTAVELLPNSYLPSFERGYPRFLSIAMVLFDSFSYLLESPNAVL
jgi:hypothetical protein